MKKLKTETGIDCTEYGNNDNKKCFVLNNGITLDQSHLKQVGDYFANNSSMKLISYDQPNQGESDIRTVKNDCDYKLQREAFGDVLNELAKDNNIIHAGGYSYSGATVMNETRNNLVSYEVLISPYTDVMSFLPPNLLNVIKMQPKAIADTICKLLGMKPVYLNATVELFKGDETYKDISEKNGGDWDNELRGFELLNCILNAPWLGMIKELKAKYVTVVNAKNDKVISPSSTRRFAKMINADLIEYDGGHGDILDLDKTFATWDQIIKNLEN